jgi:anti-sigma factor RsiW
MPMTDPKRPGRLSCNELGSGQPALEEGFTAKVSAYLDGELYGQDLAQFEALLKADEALALEVAGMRRIGQQLTKLGADILAEPIPDALLETLTRLEDQG